MHGSIAVCPNNLRQIFTWEDFKSGMGAWQPETTKLKYGRGRNFKFDQLNRCSQKEK